MLTKDAIITQLIYYDSEHPETLGAMADRREIYAQRILEMANAADIVPEKFVTTIGDGVNNRYVINHPFGLRDIVVSVYLTDGMEQLSGNEPDKFDGYVVFNFWRRLNMAEVTVVIVG